MKAFLSNHKRLLIEILVMVSVFIFVFIAYFLHKPYYFRSTIGFGTTDGFIVRVFTFTCIGIIVVTGVFLKIKNKLSVETLLFLIFLLGVIMQLQYMLITPYNYRQHDVFSYNDCGHQGYAWYIYTTGELPTTLDKSGHLDYQLYHPPFNATMQAIFMEICRPFMKLYNNIFNSNYYDVDSNNINIMYQTSEILSTFYMNVSIFFAVKLVYKLKVDNKFKAFGALFICLFPALMILAGQENNDPLCIMNCFIVIYFTACWWEKHSWFNAAMIGLFTGLAMFAKLSGALIVIPAVVAFAYTLIRNIIKKEKFVYLLLQGLMIGVLIAPLGLWFQIYAKIKFDQPFGWVFSNLNTDLYVGFYTFSQRFIDIFNFADLYVPFWGNTFIHYNLPNFLIKSALFGEYSFMYAEALAVIALTMNYLFVYLSLILMILYFIFSKKENLEIKIIGGVIIVIMLGAQLYFNIKMPYGCTMDFRYIVPILLGFMILDTLAFDKFIKEKGWKRIYATITLVVMCVFLSSITIFYLVAI